MENTQYCQDVNSFQLDLQIQCIPNQNPRKLLLTNKMILKFLWKGKRPRIVNTILKETKSFGGLTRPNFKIYYKATVSKIISYKIKKKNNKQLKSQAQDYK